MLAQDAVTPRVNALAKLMGDTVEAFFERPNGEIVIVFTNKGKHTFKPEPVNEPEVPDFEEEVLSFVPPIIHTKEEAEEAVNRLPDKSKRKEKRN